MHFSAKVEKPMKSRAGRASKKPYALYAPLLGVGPFPAFSLLSAYGRIRKPSESGLGPTARRHRSLFRTPKAEAHADPHTDFADFGRKRPPMKSIRLRPSLIPFDARAGFRPWKRFFGPSDGLSSFWGMVVAIRFAPCRRGCQGFDFQAMTSTEIKKRPGDVIVFSDDSIRSTVMPQDGLRAIHRPQAIGDPLSGPLEIKTGSGFQWRNQARLHNSFTFMRPYALRMQPYAVRMHFLPASKKLGGSKAE